MTTRDKRPPLPILKKQAAVEAGRTRYFTGEPCRYGHVAERYAQDSNCVECKRVNNKARIDHQRWLREENRRRHEARKLTTKKPKEQHMDRNAYTLHQELQNTAVETARLLRQDKAAADAVVKAREALAKRRRPSRLVHFLAALDVVLVAFAISRAF